MDSFRLLGICLAIFANLFFFGESATLEDLGIDGITVNALTISFEEGLTNADLRLVKVNPDNDGPLGIVDTSPPGLSFEFVEDNGDTFLHLKQELDREDTALCPENQQASEFGCLQFINFDDDGRRDAIIIQLLDSNDNVPRFTQTCTSAEAEEEDGTLVLCEASPFIAVDADRWADRVGPTLVIENDNSAIFGISEGKITFNPPGKCDYETNTLHVFDVVAKDNGDNEVRVPMTVFVSDTPDTAPIWTQANSFSVKETVTDMTTPIVTVLAVDGDRGINAKITYDLQISPSGSYFKINPETGEIFVNASLDATAVYNDIGTLILETTLSATEDPAKGGMTSKRQIYITIEDTNDKPIEVIDAPTEVSHPETSGGNICIFKVQDKDPDLFFGSYNISISSPAEDWFQDAIDIFPKRGFGLTEVSVSVKSVNLIDYDKIEQWRLPVQFTVNIEPDDPTGAAETAKITLNIQGENDNTPTWNMPTLEVHVEENTDSGPLGITLVAGDEDFETDFGVTSLRYSWGIQPPSCLVIDNITGVITVDCLGASPFDHEARDWVEYEIKVTDNVDGPPANQRTTTEYIRIIVDDINDESPIIRVSTSSITVMENTALSEALPITITVDDPDAGSLLECTLSVDSELEAVHKWFVVEACEPNRTPVIKVAGNINREQPEYNVERVQLTLTVTDNQTDPLYPNSRATSTIFTIRIEDVNDESPEIISEGDYLIDLYILETRKEMADENDVETPAQRRIADIYAADQDSGTVFCFELGPSDIYNRSDLTLIEFVGTAVTPDCAASSTTGRATLSRASGKLIDRESLSVLDGNSSLYYTLTVYDTGKTNSKSVPIQIKVLDRNDEDPAFSATYTFSVDENDSDQVCETVELGFVSATDDDDCSDDSDFGCVSYVIPDTNNDGSDAFQVYYADGKFSTRNNCRVDRETKATYQLQLVAIDSYVPELPLERQTGRRVTTRVELIIKDINDNRPDFHPTFAADDRFDPVKEEIQSGTDIGFAIGITDADEAENGTVSSVEIVDTTCVRSNGASCPSGGVFALRAAYATPNATFQLYTANNSDFQFGYGTYCISVMATDSGTESLSRTVSYCIEVEDINNNGPKWTPDTLSYNGTTFIVSEGDARPGLPLQKNGSRDLLPLFVAEDEDEPMTDNSNVVYEILTDDPQGEEISQYVEIDNTGQLVWKSFIDVKDLSDARLRLCMRASDNGEPVRISPDLCIILGIASTQKFHPEFLVPPNNTVDVSIEENLLGLVDSLPSAVDKDIQDGGGDTIYYHILGLGESQRFFEQKFVDDQLELHTKEALDRETLDYYEVLIYATNWANDIPEIPSPLNSSYLLVRVQVEDVLDYTPNFGRESITAGASVSYTALGDVLIPYSTLLAEDLDLNDTVTYSITDITISDPSLDRLPDPPLNLVTNGDLGANITLGFTPQSSMQGYLSFTVTATDSVGETDEVQCKVYMVNEVHFTQLVFLNDYNEVLSKRQRMIDIVSAAFGYACNVDRIDQTTDGSSGGSINGSTTVSVHFIDEQRLLPVRSSEIDAWKFSNPARVNDLARALAAEELILNVLGNQEEPAPGTDSNTIALYAMIAVAGVLVAVIIILGAFYAFKTRSLERKRHAAEAAAEAQKVTTDTRGGQEAPNTNQYSVNPVWSEDDNGRKMPTFDTESMVSRGSSLVGVEDQEDFKDHQDQNNPAFEDEFTSSGDEGTEAQAYGSIRNPAYSFSSNGEPIGDAASFHKAGGPGSEDNDNPLYATVSRRNPLANLGYEED